MEVNIFKDCEAVLDNGSIEARRRYVSDSTAAIEMQLQPGGEIPEHGTPESVFFYILEGTGLLSVNGEVAEVSEGMVSQCASNVKKYIKNNSDKLLRVLVVKMN